MRANKKNNPRYKAILEVAAKIFSQKGYHHANVSEIAQEVNLLKGSLYYYIKSKEELLYEVIMSAVDLYIDSLKEIAISMNDDPCDAVKKAIIAHVLPMDIDFDRIYVFLNNIQDLSEEYRKDVEVEIKNYEKMWISILDLGKRKGLFRADLDSKITMLSVFGMCNWTLRWYRPDAKFNMLDLATIYANNILMGIKRRD